MRRVPFVAIKDPNGGPFLNTFINGVHCCNELNVPQAEKTDGVVILSFENTIRRPDTREGYSGCFESGGLSVYMRST